jgi:hypothetical protein
MVKFSRQELKQRYFSGLDIEFDDTLINFKNYSVVINMSMDEVSSFSHKGTDLEQLYNNILYNEMSNSILKEIQKSVTNLDKVVNLTNLGTSSIKELNNFLNSFYSDNFIISSGIVQLLLDLPNFIYDSASANVANSFCYKIGKFNNINIAVDPCIRYGDTKITSYDKIKMNLIINEPIQIIDSDTFRPKTQLNFKLDFKLENHFINYLINEDTSEDVRQKVIPELIKINRDKILNILLND